MMNITVVDHASTVFGKFFVVDTANRYGCQRTEISAMVSELFYSERIYDSMHETRSFCSGIYDGSTNSIGCCRFSDFHSALCRFVSGSYWKHQDSSPVTMDFKKFGSFSEAEMMSLVMCTSHWFFVQGINCMEQI
ncbi:hypothetical protein TNCV_1712541 [Trichonephila clavipes]|nr:hypothetical protein TNCV_1712541 [Trichonephila clavipes]